MAKPPDKRIIRPEDFPEESRATVDQLSTVLNLFIEQVTALFNKNIDFDNLAQEVATLTFTTGEDGQPLSPLTFKCNLKARIKGILPISVKILNNNGFVTSTPFINFTQNDKIVAINYISGLQPETKYTLTLLII